MLHPNLESQDLKTLEALEFYCSHTAQIEVVRHDRSLGMFILGQESSLGMFTVHFRAGV